MCAKKNMRTEKEIENRKKIIPRTTDLSKFDTRQNSRPVSMQNIGQPSQADQLEALGQPVVRGAEAGANVARAQPLRQLNTLLEQVREAGRLLAQPLERRVIPRRARRSQTLVQVPVQVRVVGVSGGGSRGLAGACRVGMHQMNNPKANVL